MAYASQSGRARTSASNPQAFGVCQRCGFWYNHVDLRFQFDWRGASLQNLQILVCQPCYDVPTEQLRAIVVPADPIPIQNARVEPFLLDETDYRGVSAPTVYDPVTGIPIPNMVGRATIDGQDLTNQPMGIPTGLEPGAIMPLNGTVHYGVQLPVLSVISSAGYTVTVTCSSPHGLSTNSQVSVEGLSINQANGFYSVTVTTATAFTYTTNLPIAATSLLTATTRIVTANVGIPYGYAQIPQTGS